MNEYEQIKFILTQIQYRYLEKESILTNEFCIHLKVITIKCNQIIRLTVQSENFHVKLNQLSLIQIKC